MIVAPSRSLGANHPWLFPTKFSPTMNRTFARSGRPDEFAIDANAVADRSVSGSVIRVVAALRGEEVDVLPPIAETVDPEALDDLMMPALDDPAVTNTTVTSHYHGFHITICSDGELRFRPTVDNPPP